MQRVGSIIWKPFKTVVTEFGFSKTLLKIPDELLKGVMTKPMNDGKVDISLKGNS